MTFLVAVLPPEDEPAFFPDLVGRDFAGSVGQARTRYAADGYELLTAEPRVIAGHDGMMVEVVISSQTLHQFLAVASDDGTLVVVEGNNDVVEAVGGAHLSRADLTPAFRSIAQGIRVE
jgi:hypothetical protein